MGLGGLWRGQNAPDSGIKQALNLEKAVEGADLVINRFKLQVV